MGFIYNTQEQAMVRLQAACFDIPSMTTATKELHGTVTTLVLDAHSMQQQERVALQNPGTATVSGASTMLGGAWPGSTITSTVRDGFT